MPLFLFMTFSIFIQIPRQAPARVRTIYRVIQAIREHVGSDEPLPGAGEAVRIDKPTDVRVVVAALEVVEPGLAVEIIASIPDRIDRGDRCAAGGADAEDLAEGVVAVAPVDRSVPVDDLHYVALQVRHVVVQRPVIAQDRRAAALVVVKLQRVPAPGLRDQPAALPGVLVLHGVRAGAHRLRQAQAVRVVGKGHGGVTAGNRADARELTPPHPGHRRPVVPGLRVADLVVADRVGTVLGQQIGPLAVAIGVGYGIAAHRL